MGIKTHRLPKGRGRNGENRARSTCWNLHETCDSFDHFGFHHFAVELRVDTLKCLSALGVQLAGSRSRRAGLIGIAITTASAWSGSSTITATATTVAITVAIAIATTTITTAAVVATAAVIAPTAVTAAVVATACIGAATATVIIAAGRVRLRLRVIVGRTALAGRPVGKSGRRARIKRTGVGAALIANRDSSCIGTPFPATLLCTSRAGSAPPMRRIVERARLIAIVIGAPVLHQEIALFAAVVCNRALPTCNGGDAAVLRNVDLLRFALSASLALIAGAALGTT